jgi:hypothetical protein
MIQQEERNAAEGVKMGDRGGKKERRKELIVSQMLTQQALENPFLYTAFFCWFRQQVSYIPVALQRTHG